MLFVLFFPIAACAQLKGKVVRIADGDTFTILVDEKQIRVRLHGIDSPEKGQDYSNAAKNYLSGLIMHKTVEILQKNKDRYGRTIGIAFVNGININEKLLEQGYAWHYTRYDKNPAWTELEECARTGKRGLWASKNPIAPWVFRKK